MLFSSSLGLGLGLDFVFGLLVVMQYAHIFVISAVIVRCPLDWRMVSKTVATGIVIILMFAVNCVDHLMNRVVTSSFDFFLQQSSRLIHKICVTFSDNIWRSDRWMARQC